jgi:hypothetical protein
MQLRPHVVNVNVLVGKRTKNVFIDVCLVLIQIWSRSMSQVAKYSAVSTCFFGWEYHDGLARL